MMEIKPKVREESVQLDSIPWKAFPDALSHGGIRWKMLHASPEMGAWTAIFDCYSRTVPIIGEFEMMLSSVRSFSSRRHSLK
jgi:hypothetical protein